MAKPRKAPRKPRKKYVARKLEPSWTSPDEPLVPVAPVVLIAVPLEKTKDPMWHRILHWIVG